MVASCVFLWAWAHQHAAHRILARLRTGRDTAPTYKMPPSEDWFRLVSCPHYLAEVIMYGSLAVILGWGNTAGLATFVWVLLNQAMMAITCHRWYKEKFAEYPPDRRAIIPGIL